LKYILAIFQRRTRGSLMTGYSKALCSILGTLLSVALVSSPVLAQGKKKKKAAEEAPAAEAEVEASGSLDSLMESAADKKKDDKKKKGKKGEEEAPAEEAPPAEEEVVEEPDAWERPPVEEKAPAKEAPKAVDTTPALESPISIALLLGYGFKTDRRTGHLGADPYGFMAGVRGGYTFDFMLYTGLYFNYYFGSSQTGGGQRTVSTDSTTTASYMHFGAEVGYDVDAGPVLFRPSLQIGMALGLTDETGTTTTVNDMMLGPGFTLVYPIDDFFIGGDLRGAIVMGDGASAVTAAATGGMRF
jgi:hypothetical protein